MSVPDDILLPPSLATLSADDRNRLVRDVFDRVATHYDRTNDLMSLGIHRMWRRSAISILNPPRDSTPWTLLDCASGSGDIVAATLRKAGANVKVIATDRSAAMLREGVGRFSSGEWAKEHAIAEGKVRFAVADAEQLPFASRSMDAVTIAFGIRNVARFPEALREMHRVLKPGGRLVCLEFSRIQIKELESLWSMYCDKIIPLMGKISGGSEASYRYLSKSIEAFPDYQQFPCYLKEQKFSQVDAIPLSGGVAVIYSGWRSEP